MTAKERNRVLTIRNVSAEVDDAIASQARAHGRSKSEFVQELLTATFGDLIGNFCRANGWVALSDQEVAKMIDAKLSDYWFEAAQTLAENRAYCRILSLRTEDELNEILKAAIPLLAIRAKHMSDVTVLPHGVSMTFALFIEAAKREPATLLAFHRDLFYRITKEQFFDQVDEIREALRLPKVERPC